MSEPLQNTLSTSCFGIPRLGAPFQDVVSDSTSWRAIPAAGAPFLLLERHFYCWNAISTAGIPFLLLEFHSCCWNAISAAGTPISAAGIPFLLLEFHSCCWNAIPINGEPRRRLGGPVHGSWPMPDGGQRIRLEEWPTSPFGPGLDENDGLFTFPELVFGLCALSWAGSWHRPLTEVACPCSWLGRRAASMHGQPARLGPILRKKAASTSCRRRLGLACWRQSFSCLVPEKSMKGRTNDYCRV